MAASPVAPARLASQIHAADPGFSAFGLIRREADGLVQHDHAASPFAQFIELAPTRFALQKTLLARAVVVEKDGCCIIECRAVTGPPVFRYLRRYARNAP